MAVAKKPAPRGRKGSAGASSETIGVGGSALGKFFRSDELPEPDLGGGTRSEIEAARREAQEQARAAAAEARRDQPVTTLAQALAGPISGTGQAVLEAAGRRAFQRGSEPDLAFGVVTLLQAFVETGLNVTPASISATRWLCQWALDQSTPQRALAAFAGKPRRIALGDTTQIRLSPNVADVLHAAMALARRAGTDLSARHLMIALLDHPQRNAADALRREFRKATRLELETFRPTLIDNVLRERHREAELLAWRSLHTRSLPEILGDDAPPPAGDRPETLATLNDDRASASGADPLGIQPDVEAFARLICMDQAASSLSIGLFGDWGSGKSSFMERLQAAIETLTAETRARLASKPPEPEGSVPAAPAQPGFVENVVHIRFNAWHFADANLWASLTAEFFDQLRAGGSSRQGSVRHAALVERVNAHVHNLSSTLGAAREALGKSEKLLLEAQKARDKAVAEVEKAQDAALSQTLVDTVGAAYEKHKPDLFEIGRRAYQDDATKGVDDFVSVAKNVQTIGGQLTTIGEIVLARGWRIGLMLLALAFAAFAVAGLALGDKTQATGFLTQIGFWGWLGALGSASAAVLPAIRIVAGIVRSTAEFAGKLDEVTKARLKDVLAREAELKQAEAEAKARREALARAQSALARYIDPAGAANPPRLLRYILEDDPETKVFDAQIGLISRARRLFQSVDEVVRQERVRRDAGEPSDAAVPDRIVLYIDDLDRCTHEQVYAVLQAIHLLLAFDLFVVVVGVDVRWVEEAVARQFSADHDPLPDNATPAEREAARLSRETARRKRAIDYLEKIFQLPFWLRRMQTEAAAGAKPGGTYAAYVRDLLQANLEVPIDTPGIFATKAAGGGEPLGDGVPGDADDPQGEAAPEAAFADDAEFSAIDQALATVRLTQAEVDFLASPEIGAIAAKSPRAVKRLLNVYRIIRARISGPELAAFLGEAGEPPTWPIAAFLAAVECGQPVEVADAVYDALKRMEAHEMFDTASLKAIVEKGRPGASEMAEVVLMLADERSGHILSSAVHALNARRGSPERGPNWAKAGPVLAMARIVRRYSFNRYH